jgi:hypothetical protein
MTPWYQPLVRALGRAVPERVRARWGRMSRRVRWTCILWVPTVVFMVTLPLLGVYFAGIILGIAFSPDPRPAVLARMLPGSSAFWRLTEVYEVVTYGTAQPNTARLAAEEARRFDPILPTARGNWGRC